jgi:hypothetical protein
MREFLVLPGALLMALRGLRTLSTRRILRNPMPEPPNMEMRETETTTMSRQLKAYEKVNIAGQFPPFLQVSFYFFIHVIVHVLYRCKTKKIPQSEYSINSSSRTLPFKLADILRCMLPEQTPDI